MLPRSVVEERRATARSEHGGFAGLLLGSVSQACAHSQGSRPGLSTSSWSICRVVVF
jgi:hypothetical protein